MMSVNECGQITPKKGLLIKIPKTNGELGVFVKQTMFKVRYKILLGALWNYVGLVSKYSTVQPFGVVDLQSFHQSLTARAEYLQLISNCDYSKQKLNN